MAASANPRSPSRSSARPAAPAPAAAKPAAKPAGTNGASARRNETAAAAQRGETIEQCVRRALERYFEDLDGAKPHALHEMVMQAVERPLLQFALERCRGNQSAAAELLGINRNTLRKRLLAHGLAA